MFFSSSQIFLLIVLMGPTFLHGNVSSGEDQGFFLLPSSLFLSQLLQNPFLILTLPIFDSFKEFIQFNKRFKLDPE